VLYQLRDCRLDRGNVEVVSPSVQQIANSEVEHSPNIGSPSTVNRWRKLTNPGQESFPRVRTISDGHRRSIGSVSSLEGYLTPQRKFGKEASCDELGGPSRRSPSVFSMCFESCSDDPELMIPNLISNGSENVLDFSLNDFSLNNKDFHHSPSPSVLVCTLSFFRIYMSALGACYVSFWLFCD